MASRARSWRSWGAGSAWLLLAGVIAPEVSAGPPELPAGGLVLVANGHIVPEQQDVFISPERIRLVYAFKNSGETDASMLVTFALPELDMTWIWEQPPALPRTGDPNFVDAVTTADGLNVTYRMDQRAYSLGLDVTDALKAQAIPLYPYDSGIHERIRRLSATTKEDFLGRGILRAAADDKLLPAWLLRTTLYWRQPFPAGRSVTLVHSYRPVVGRPSGSLAALGRSACLEADDVRKLEKAARGADAPRLMVVGYQTTAGSSWSDSIGRFRLIIEKPSATAQIATCKGALQTVSPTQLEWQHRDYAIDDDVTVLFVD